MSEARKYWLIGFFVVALPVAYLGLVGASFSLYGRGHISWPTFCKVQRIAPGFGFKYYVWWQRHIDSKASAMIE
jgi:hypothetical protein